MEEDVELNKAVMDLVALCEKKKIVGVSRIINGYQIHFRFNKLGSKNSSGAVSQTQQIGGALSNMGDEITKTFTG